MTTIKINSRGDSVRLLQELLVKAGYKISVDGHFGKNTDKAVKEFQKKNNLVVDGIVGTKTWIKLVSSMPKEIQKTEDKLLSEKDLINLANELNIELPVIKAVNEVESSGRGFLSGGNPKILFEGHIFWKRLKLHGLKPESYVTGNEEILYPKWTKKYYKGGEKEHERLNKAKKIHESAALESASWGLFQILGYHYKICGYNSVKNFVEGMNKTEGHHLRAFGKFIQSEGLVKHLRNKDWAKFARGYNGPLYAENKYDTKLAAAYKKYSS
jgi:hypothetical protein